MQSKSTKRKRFSKLRVLVFLLGLTMVFVAGNWLYQLYKKPTEIFAPFQSYFYKTPEQTWLNYGGLFVDKSTNIITPEFLAALAQIESSGNPLASTYWKWRLTDEVGQIFSPASSAVGLFQITKPTLTDSQRFCLDRGKIVLREHWQTTPACWLNYLSFRTLPSQATEMTSARLHYYVTRLLARFNRANASKKNMQRVAAIIHLCGVRKAVRFVRNGFNLRQTGYCGDHSVNRYIRKIERMQQVFKRLRQES